jgi:NAD(P)-dependent dehydrogenase (short-subunit alcohol dehydrogenase family)/phage FluMu protein Com
MSLPDEPLFSPEEWQACLKVLQVLSRNPEAAPDTFQLKGLVTKLHKQARKSIRKQNVQEQHAADRLVKESTLLVQKETPLIPAQPVLSAPSPKYFTARTFALLQPTRCYVCKQLYREVHFFYHLLCPDCAQLNFERRRQRMNLTGRIALLTGGRIKIGYETSLKMLRDGAKVIITTRFPKEAASRYAAETDFSDWKDRLQIYQLDLRNIPAVEAFIEHLQATLPHLDILINNAAQTIRRPPDFYRHLQDIESVPVQQLPVVQQQILAAAPPPSALPKPAMLQTSLPHDPAFPVGQYDRFGQQADLRSLNSWRLGLEQVDTVELLEVQLINSIAPFLLNGKLKPLLQRSPFPRRFIINVSAMEGQFNRASKTHFHPHTNMAKAALNMMTRTAAMEYAQWGIYMNSVDTGWITDEDPHPKKMRKRSYGFVPPLDEIDGAARVYDPVVQGLLHETTPVFGHFLKDYHPHAW